MTIAVEYEERDDRKILRARDFQVVDVRAVPDFYLRLSNGATLGFDGTVIHSIGLRKDAVCRPLNELPSENLSALISTRPLSWVVFNDGSQRIMFSNNWLLTLETEPDDTWRLDLSDGRVLTYPTE